MIIVKILVTILEILKTTLTTDKTSNTENIVLWCEIQPDDLIVRWFHNDKEVTDGDKYTIRVDGSKRSLEIKGCEIVDCGVSDRGNIAMKVAGVICTANVIVKGIVPITAILLVWMSLVIHTSPI